MGSGSKKTHEAFAISPAPVVLDDEPAAGPTAVGGTVSDAAAAPAATVGPVNGVAAGVVANAAAAPAGGAGPAEVADAPAQEQLIGEEPSAVDETAASAAADADMTIGASEGTVAARDESQWNAADLLTPIPDQLAVGDGIGVAVAVGGADLLDGSAVLTSYKDAKNGAPHEVLRATLTPDAEEKLLDALSPPDAPKVPIQVPEVVSGQLPIDKQQQLHEDLARAAKSINHHIKDGTAIPQHTVDRIDTVEKKLLALQSTSAPGSAEQEMASHYLAAVQQCKERMADGFNTPYGNGGKIPMVTPFEHTGEVMVTKMVPDPTWEGAGLPVAKRSMSRIAASMDGDAVSSWDGKSRSKAPGTELAIDLGDGYQAVVRPRSMNEPGNSTASLRGTLEVIAPPGAGHQQQLLDRLGQLNIVSRPMTAGEAEWTYLQRNITAHGLDGHTAVTGALKNAGDIEEAHAHRLLMKRAQDAIGLDDAGLAQFARKLQLDAEADALPDKVRLLKDGVAAALGHANGAAMAQSASYDPTPQRARGWLTWGRIGQSAEDLKPVFAKKVMTHSITGGPENLSKVLTSGVLACTERRRMMGVGAGVGMSEHSDTLSGGASSVFLRVKSAGGSDGGARLIWNDPGRLLSRTDWYGYNGDHFGAAIAGTGHSVSGQTRDPKTVAKFTASNNEVMISHGLDLLGADAPDKVVCPSKYRPTLLADLAKAGITTIGGRPVEKVVVAG
ncbi:hypothetical protein [Mycolicibacterium mucogenicum]|jgi:hypothetical protein|uniref:hypothetical protein n=2 Tax=Mycolicibacterium mucogenicum TaxID=56689 RepID=UPI00076A3303|nr:hypothetical protein [Mycolicibacterium mucogenicum]